LRVAPPAQAGPGVINGRSRPSKYRDETGELLGTVGEATGEAAKSDD